MALLTLAAFMDEGGMVFVLGSGVAMLAIICATIKNVTRTKAREQSRREIAAYIAEGSMTPEQGEKLMAAGEKPEKS